MDWFKRVFLISLLSLFSSLLLQVAGSGAEESRGVLLRGSTSVMPFASEVAEAYMQKHPGTPVTVRGGGSLRGIKALLDGTADIAMSSTTITEDLFRYAEANNVSFAGNTVAFDGVVPIVHPSRSPLSLSLEQLRMIFTGRIKNWSEVGGTEGPIVVISANKLSGTFETWMEKVIGTNAVITPAAKVLTKPETKRVVSQNLNAIGYIPLGMLDPQVAEVGVENVLATQETIRNGSYPIIRELKLYTLSSPSEKVRNLLNYFLSPEAQLLTGKAGNVPVKGRAE